MDGCGMAGGRVALPGDNCFGTPITYKYTRDFELIRFPRELAVLSRYPRCWSHLAPIICTTFYRPCSRHFFVEKDERNNVMFVITCNNTFRSTILRPR
ncbi:hypothetical protein KIN20_004412 [Parelaphostrongylus tenuis]|uniref:Uncharacterized protein n=1 Tax=Parelaphostrongylus tenuis TaxID=148309 RepID=A0AAD5MJX1_PARTN|nr:hypothetical protein KIN20_004412 [Parelaphostrongylus tenuis]